MNKFPPSYPDGYTITDIEYDSEADELVTTREDGLPSPPVKVRAAITTSLRARQVAVKWFLS